MSAGSLLRLGVFLDLESLVSSRPNFFLGVRNGLGMFLYFSMQVVLSFSLLGARARSRPSFFFDSSVGVQNEKRAVLSAAKPSFPHTWVRVIDIDGRVIDSIDIDGRVLIVLMVGCTEIFEPV